MNTYIALSLVLVGVFDAGVSGHAAPFLNLNFEGTIIPDESWSGFAPTEQLLPGWTLTLDSALTPGGQPVKFLKLDVPSAGTPDAWLTSTRYLPSDVIQGNYTLYLTSGVNGTGNYDLSQNGTIPEDALSLRFQAAHTAVDVRINGTRLFVYDESPVDTWYSADISGSAGKTVTLDFATAGSSPSGLGLVYSLDNIQFSPDPAIPEPKSGYLVIIGGVTLWLVRVARRWRRAASAID